MICKQEHEGPCWLFSWVSLEGPCASLDLSFLVGRMGGGWESQSQPSIPLQVAKILDFSDSCVIGQFCTAAWSRHPFLLPSLGGPLLLPMHTHVLPKHLGTCTCTYATTLRERKNWIQSQIFTQESQNDSYAFTQLSIKWNPIFLVKFQTGERAQNSNRDGVLGKQFL